MTNKTKEKAGEWVQGIWIPNQDTKINNPKGFNKHKKAPKKNVKLEIKPTKDALIKELGEVFHKQWVLKREVLSLGHRVSQINEELVNWKRE